MKIAKLSLFALTLGIFIISCGNGKGDAAATDSAAAATSAPVASPVPAAPADTMTAPPANPDSSAAGKTK